MRLLSIEFNHFGPDLGKSTVFKHCYFLYAALSSFEMQTALTYNGRVREKLRLLGSDVQKITVGGSTSAGV